MILFFAVWQITTAIAGHFFVPVVEFCHRRYNGFRSQFHSITFFTLLMSRGWSGLLSSSGYGADTATQTMMLCIHVGIICVGGLTFSMIPQAALVYIITLGISVQFHIALQSHPLSPLLNAAVILFVLLLSRAFFQMFNQFVGRMRSDAELRELRSEEHTSELQSLMRISYAVFCLKKKNYTKKKY